MKIPEPSPALMPGLIHLAATRPRQSTPSTDGTPVDRIEVSADARALVGADDLARARRIAALRTRIDAGAYTVDPTVLARRLAERGEA